MAVLASFVLSPWSCKSNSDSVQQNCCRITVSRRVLVQAGFAIFVSGAHGGAVERVQAAEGNDKGPSNIMRRLFAEDMETGMASYEANIAALKGDLFAEITNTDVIADVGIGTAPNLRFLPKGSKVIGVDPNPYMWPFATEKANTYGIDLRLVDGVCESLPLEANSCDYVITTLTLCSVNNPSTAIKEILRVLKPGGTLIFIEHVVAPPSRPVFRAVQNILNPLQVALANGCHLNRDTAAILRQTSNPGFTEIKYKEFDAHFGIIEDFLNPARPHIAGYARKENV